MKSMSANGDPSPVDGATGRNWVLRLPVMAPRRSGPSRFGDSGQTRRDGPGGHAALRRRRPPQPDTASGEHQSDVSHSRNRRKVLKVRKPKEGSGRSRWQHRGRQRTRQWSKALWSAGCTHSISRGNTVDGMTQSAGERAEAAVTRYGCWRGEAFEGCGATGKENAGREFQPHHQRRARVRVPGNDRGNVVRARTSPRTQEVRQRTA